IEQARALGHDARAKLWLYLSICVNLGILGFFKYFNFFSEGLANFASMFGITLSSLTYDIILPVGISFYTFQTMSYTIDVYRKKQNSTKNLLDFALFVSFFPQLMAGPIERARKLLPQIQRPRKITSEMLREGGWLLFWGFFKKVFIADNLVVYTNWAFNTNGAATSMDMYVAAIAFSIRFYCDFSGYSDMARGLAKLLGINLSINFRLPYFASNPTMLWNRWHITLSNWFRDYVYASLRGFFVADYAKVAAAFVTMTLAGLWHGANYKFMLWGACWGGALVAHRVCVPVIATLARSSPYVSFMLRGMGILLTYHLWILLGFFFASLNMTEAVSDLKIWLFDFTTTDYVYDDMRMVLFYSMPLILMQLAQGITGNLNIIKKFPAVIRVLIYIVMVLLLIVMGAENDPEFIYFQF
ncbi:MAG: MBOAT family protein, partial [Deltaproteobacteria bacterium]|nr:MBOAT family protein [Deltaproteobacteria bacterium]